jgi:ABC-type antimicrobial peptide transport system permease subunit
MLSLRSLPVRSARHHWRANVPVVLGVAIGTAVLTGALLVGDSLRGSLHDRAVRQLNGVESAYVGNRLVRAEIGKRLPVPVHPAMILQGPIQTGPGAVEEKRLGRVTVIGLDEAGFQAFGLPAGGAVLSARVAERLSATAGQPVELSVQKFTAVPRSSFLGRRDVEATTAGLRIEVAAVLPVDHPANDFSLLPNPAAPLNVFVPLDRLQQNLSEPGKVNSFLALSGTTEQLNEEFAAGLMLEDWGLRIRVAPKRKEYVVVDSDGLFLPPAIVPAVERAVRDLGMRSDRTLAYLANAISAGTEPVWTRDAGDPNRVIPYSVVAALDPTAVPPLGPFLPAEKKSLAEDEIVLTAWPDSPLAKLKPGDPVTLTYFKPEMEAAVEETSATLRFAGFIPLEGPADDPDLAPSYPGVTDKLSIRDWNAPFELNNKRIRPRDEKYWERYRTTPKAYITRAKGEQFFGSRFGTVTGIRVAPAAGQSPDDAAAQLRTAILGSLDPRSGGFQFEPTRERLLAASRGGTDFGMLFLAFSGLLILAALFLVGLLFRLAMERRAREVGLFLASGYSARQVRRLLLVEGSAVAAIGALVGAGLAVAYAWGMLRFLTALWPDAEIGRYLGLHVTLLSLVIGFFGSVLVATASIWWSVRGLVHLPPPALLRGETRSAESMARPGRRSTAALVTALGLAVVGIGLLLAGGGRSNPDERSMAFFGGGGLLLAGGLVLARALFRSTPAGVLARRGTGGLAVLGFRNARRNPGRSLLTATLIALATFLVVSVESFRRKPDEDFLKLDGGSGGFQIVAESDVPLFQPFDRGPGKDDLLDRLQQVYQQAESRDPGGLDRKTRLDRATALLDTARVFSFRVQGGDDASCLNLNQAGRPRVYGVPDALIDRGGFRFSQTTTANAEERSNPWRLLTGRHDDGAIPVFAEQNTALFMLRTPVGGSLTIPDENGQPVRVRIVGTLQDSPFQSELLMSDDNFRKLYPRQEGYRAFLIDVPAENQSEYVELLETGLRANGLVATPTVEKVAVYQAVVGAYLSTFQLLGGFALLLAVLGLGVVVLRSVWERVGELALLRAVGFGTAALQTTVVAETLLVLAVGLGIGVISAVASVLPNLALGGEIPYVRFLFLALAVGVVGLVVAWLATTGVARMPLVPALRKE